MSARATVVLGLSCDYHDAAAALLVDGEVVAAVEQERFSRQKHDDGMPTDAVACCLDHAGLHAAEVDHLVFYEKPLSSLTRFVATRRRQGPGGLGPFIGGASRMVGRNLLIGPRVARMMTSLGAYRPPRLQYIEHHRSHAAAAFFASPFEHAAVLTIDGLGEWATATIGVGSRHRLTLLEEQRFPNSLGLVYSFVTAYCGFAPNSDEYKLMGLAPYGDPRFVDALGEIVRVNDDGSLWVDARALGWFSDRPRPGGRLQRLFDGPPRNTVDVLGQREADLAASVQQLAEQVVLRMAARARELTGETAVCLGGGVALNCVANGRLAREGPFERLWVQPAAGDAGSAVGAALSYWHEVLGRERRADGTDDLMSGAFLGPGLPSAGEIVGMLDGLGVDHELVDPDLLYDTVAARLAQGQVVGWCQGRMEFGPRALGHRSILADPRQASLRDRINLEVKGRESFRPFAPAVLAERARDWFDLDHASPYMLLVAPVRGARPLGPEQMRLSIGERAAVPLSDLPACTHVDGSARIQTVEDGENPEFAGLLRAFDALTGCPVLLNTSFNRAGEPIVATVQQAVAAASAGGLDLLVLDRVLVEGASLRRLARAEVGGA